MAIWNRSRSKKPDSRSGPQPLETDTVFRLEEAIRLKGELIASTDVEIRGQLDGTVRLDGYCLVIAATGQVMADVSARRVQVIGQVVGNVTASERIRIESGGCVLGDLCAPSIQLEEGSQFTGGINRQSAPAKVTGRLSGAGCETSPRSEIDGAAAQARHEGLYDQRGNKN